MVLLADVILVFHFLFVLGVVLPVPLIALGGWRGWRWVRNRFFRRVHLAMISIVVFETLVGMFCPLTEWEQQLRAASGRESYEGSFIQYWVSRLLFYEFEPWLFTMIYIGFGLLIAWLYIKVPPAKRQTKNY
ncbi:MAG TPA: DUF2784 domain-containing protein [Bdellovibrionales bacterium]|nr:MAG: hypothetical protein A2Z97_10300 [Bdellovibrionales bacterium GWB1_52_6]OFZ03336.1 MAG: hypothetical protein A2X97_05175 [Bdellovibrionales bacterium GWA1_52_35]OFZ36339.1 MAG: hypothetical protein A2070_06725 [Bdellovibrionales bacterium GWC1_52_8]HAR43713.1 DUF2784 domain-containing protein [Bdellovibrionales bacterium]HCM40919.1 DUF2784 domain-containing protein [Bdellovibrionales bacterium]